MSVIIEGAGAVRQSIYHYTIDMAWVCILFRFYFCEIYIFQGSTKASLGPSYVNYKGHSLVSSLRKQSYDDTLDRP